MVAFGGVPVTSGFTIVGGCKIGPFLILRGIGFKYIVRQHML